MNKITNLTRKYKFRATVDQFNVPTRPDYIDMGEIHVLNFFESVCLQLPKVNSLANGSVQIAKRKPYSMIELGSNQAYYSLLFKHILGPQSTTNIMIEPSHERLDVGKKQFAINKCEGIFYCNGIGSNWIWNNNLEFSAPPITLNQVMSDNQLEHVDILHCDIDGSEMLMLEENRDIFTAGKVEYLFLFTHRSGNVSTHEPCKEYFDDSNYELIYEWTYNPTKRCVATDDTLVFKLKH